MMKFIFLIYFIYLLDIGGTVKNAYELYDGDAAKPYSAPYIVSLKMQFFETDTPKHRCAGAILNENWILTTVNCAQTTNKQTIVAGEYDLTNDEGVEQYRKIAKIIIHEKYYPIGFQPYDIALIKVEKPFQFNDLVKAIALPRYEASVKGTVTLYGWDSITNETHPEVLQTTTRELVSLEECRSYKGERVHETNFCMGPLDQDNDACVVDNGGPIVQENSGKIELLGLSSWRSIICWPGPYVNVRVSAFIDWINENMD